MVEGREKAAYLLALLDLGSALSASLLLALALLEKSLRHVDGLLGRNGAVATVELVRSPQVAMYREGRFRASRVQRGAPVGELPIECDILSGG